MAVSSPKVLFFPITEPSYLNVFIEKPIGTDINETDGDSRVIEQKVLNYFNQVPGYYFKTLANGDRDTIEIPDTNLMPIVQFNTKFVV